MRIIDSHVHVLDRYPPMEPFEDLGRWDRLLYLMDQEGVEMAVLVPVVADFSPDNNEECARLARKHPDRFAALTDVQLHEPGAAGKIAEARERFGAVGISYYPSSANLGWMLDFKTEPVWDALEESGLVCSMQIRPQSYPILLALARKYSRAKFVAHHLGLPALLEMGSDYGGLMEAAPLANLSVKVSGFYAATETPWDFRCERAHALFNALLDGLGPDRLMWGSDWPPSGRHLTYRQSLELIRTFAHSLDGESRVLVLGESTAGIYQI